MTVFVTRAVSIEQVRTSRLGWLWLLRRERKAAKVLAMQQVGGFVRMTGIRVARDGPKDRPILVMGMEFTPVQFHTHHYKPVARCHQCDRRWGEHAIWEKA